MSASSSEPPRPSQPADGDRVARWKHEAARAVVAEVPDSCVLGLGSGTTAEVMLSVLAERVRAGLRVLGVPTSERTAQLASGLGIPLTTLDSVESLTMSIDGADEVLLPTLDLIKGRGGALLREKLVASASRLRVIIVDASKIVPTLAASHPVPVEIEPFGWHHTYARLVALGAQPTRRVLPGPDGTMPSDPAAPPFLTDGGHYILDCVFAPIAAPAALAARIKALPGVVDTGLFVGMTERVYVAGSDGVRRYDRPAS